MSQDSPSLRNPRPEEIATDWYLPCDDPVSGFVYPGPVFVRTSQRLIDVALRLGDLCKERDLDEFVIKDGGLLYRGHRIPSVDGVMFSLRRVPTYVPTLDEIGMDRSVQALLMHKKMGLGGLVLISGETGQGKSTSAAAFIKGRLEKFGSFCLTLEDPPELPLNGKIGQAGICIQTDVKSGGFGDAIKGAVRSYPTQGNSILYVGETRDPETAGEVLRIATNGHLVVTTIHGADVISAVKRFMSLALSYKNMTEAETRSVFSSALRLVVHQKLKDMPDGNRRLDVRLLFSPDHSSVVANRIRSGSVEGLSTDVQQQSLLIQQGQVEKLLMMFDSSALAGPESTKGFSGTSSMAGGGMTTTSRLGRGDTGGGSRDGLDDVRR